MRVTTLVGIFIAVLCGLISVGAHAAEYKYYYFEGDYSDVSDLIDEIPVEEGFVDDLTLEPRDVDQNYGFRFVTDVTVVDGEYYDLMIGLKGQAKITFANYTFANASFSGDNVNTLQSAFGGLNGFPAGTYNLTIDFLDQAGDGDIQILYSRWSTGGSNAPLTDIAEYGPEFAGVRYQFFDYEDGASALPDLNALTPTATGELASVVKPSEATDSSFAVRYEGYLDITEPGNYRIYKNFEGTVTQERWGNYTFSGASSDNANAPYASGELYFSYGEHAFVIDIHAASDDALLSISIVTPSGTVPLADMLVSDSGGGATPTPTPTPTSTPTATPTPTPAPAIPSVTDVSAALTSDTLTLMWTPVASDAEVSSYIIYSGVPVDGDYNFSQIANVAASLNSFSPSVPSAGTTGYWLQSLTADGQSPEINDSPSIILDIPAAFPAITDFTGVEGSATVDLSWSADNIASDSHFILERSVNDGSFEALASIAASSNTYSDTSAPQTSEIVYRLVNERALTDTQSGASYIVSSNLTTLTLTTTELEPETGVVDYQYFEGQFTPFPDFSALTPVRSGKMNTIDLSPAPAIDGANYALRYTWTLHIDRPGDYNFVATTRNVAMRMNTVIAAYGGAISIFNVTDMSQSTTAQSGSLYKDLSTGEYSVVIETIAEYANPLLELSFEFNGGPRQPIVNLFGLDSDNDGVKDALDPYPSDPARSNLETPQGLSAEQQGQNIELSWTALDLSNSNVANTRIFRRQHGSGDYASIATIAASQSSYVDSSASNGIAYDYLLTNLTSAELSSDNSDSASAFLAYNTVVIDSFSAEQETAGVNLHWSSEHTGDYQVLRGLRGGALSVLTTIADTTYVDTTVQTGRVYDYAVQTLVTFTNPLINEPVLLPGPTSSRQQITMPSALIMRLVNLTEVANGQYGALLGPNSAATLVLQGEFEDALDTVSISAQSGSQNIAASVSGSTFTLSLPRPTSATQWQIIGTVSTDSVQQQGALTLDIAWDQSGPSIAIDGDSPRSTAQDVLTVTGTVTDPNGVATVEITSNRYGDQSFSVFVDDSGQFSADVPIEFDENFIKISAVDSVANPGYEVLVVQRDNINRPKLSITSHINGQVIKDSAVTLSGELISALPLADITLQLDGSVMALQEQASGRYAFTAADLSLQQGRNTFEFVANAGSESARLSFTLHYDPELQLSDPSISNIRPLPGSRVNNASFMFAATVSADYPITSVTVNGAAMTLFEHSSTANISTLVDFAGASSMDVVLVASAINGQSVEQTYSYSFDDQPPAIASALVRRDRDGPDNTLTNRVFDNPYEFTGVVTDDNFSSVTVNEQVVDVFPGDEAGQYLFQTIINLNTLASGDTTLVTVKAYDLAGNTASEFYELRPMRNTEIEIIAPRLASEFIVDDTHYDLQILARAENLPEDPWIYARVKKLSEMTGDEILNPTIYINFSEVTLMTLFDNGVITGEITMPADSDRYLLQLFVQSGVYIRDEKLKELSFANREFEIDNKFTQPLELLRSEPVNLATGIEPNEPIVLYFNKGFNADKMTLTVTETAHGKTYLNSDPLGANFLMARGQQLEEVHRQQSIVPGGLSQLPGDNIYAFYPARDFAYGGLVQVEVAYRGTDIYGNDEEEKIRQFQFNIRPLPTMVEGLVVDQLGQTVSNIKVSMPELGRETLTDGEGAFSFGYGDKADQTMKGGLYNLIVNPNLKDRRFGELARQVNVANGELNEAGIIRLPVLNSQTPFYAIESGQAAAVLAAGELTLDLSGAKLGFANGKDSGQVHLNFMQMSDINLGVFGNLLPNWVFAVQPQGVTTSGPISLAIKAPKIDGSLAYLPEEGSLVLLMGRHASQPQLIPVGAGRIENGWINSYRPVEYPLLDYIGYTIVPQMYQPALQRFADGDIGMAQLISDMKTISDDVLQEVQ